MVSRHARPGTGQRIHRGAGGRQQVHFVVDDVAQENDEIQILPAAQLAVDGFPGIGEFRFAVHLRIAHEGDTKVLRMS